MEWGKQSIIFVTCWFHSCSTLVPCMTTVLAIRMAGLFQSYYFQQFAVSLGFLSAPELSKKMNERTDCHSQWASSAQLWNTHTAASHTWAGSLALRLCVCLISFLSWGLVFGAFAGMNKARQFKSLSLCWNLSFGHGSPVRRKCFTTCFREKRRNSSVILRKADPVGQLASFAFAQTAPVLQMKRGTPGYGDKTSHEWRHTNVFVPVVKPHAARHQAGSF